MSWDVVLIRTKDNNEPLDEIEAENIIPFTRTEIIGEMSKIALAQNAFYDKDNPSCHAIYNDKWSVEFLAGDREEEETVMLMIRGSEEPKEVLKALAENLGTRVADCGTGEFMEFDAPSGFEAWKKYRDKIIEQRR